MSAIHANVYEDRARYEKATTLARYLYKEFLRVASEADDEMWEKSAAKAGVNRPSAETRELVLEILKGKEPARA